MPWEKQFDVDIALAKAGEAFWTNGYEATSMRDLLEVMGIQKGSFYATYGSKKEAYLGALQQYADSRFASFRGLIADQPPRRSIEILIEAVFDDCVQPDGHRGCMVMNCAVELAHSDIDAQRFVQRTLEAHEQLFADCIRAAQAAGELRADIDPAKLSKALLGMIMGMRVYSRVGAPCGTLRALADQAIALLDG